MIFFVGQEVKLPPFVIPTRGVVSGINTIETADGVRQGISVVFEVVGGKRELGFHPEDLELVPKALVDPEGKAADIGG